MQRQKSVKAAIQALLVFVLMMFCLWQFVTQFAHMATAHPGVLSPLEQLSTWAFIIGWALATFFSVKLLPQQHPVRSAFRAAWNKA